MSQVSEPQSVQVAPPFPQALFASVVTQVRPSDEQQPGQVEGSHLQVGAAPEVSQKRNFEPSQAPVAPHAHRPLTQAFASRGSQVMVHAPPGMPQLMVVTGAHELPEPHEFESQMQPPPMHTE